MCKIKDCYIIETGYWIDKNKNIFKRKEFIPYNLLNVIKFKRNNFAIFKTQFRYDCEDQDKANKYGDFYLDFDSDDFEYARKDALKAISYFKIVFNIKDIESNIKIYFSGSKGIHLVLPCEIYGLQPRNDLNEVYKTIAEAINLYTTYKTLDLKIYDSKRLFRIPNSIHEKTSLYKVQLTIDELRYSSEEEIKKISKSNRTLKNSKCNINLSAKKMFDTFIDRTQIRLNDYKDIKSKGTLKYTPPCIINILESGSINGQRNNTIAILSSFFKSSGKSYNETYEILKKWNDEKNYNPVSENELRRTILSLYNTDKSYGCSSIKTLELCTKDNCKFSK